MGCRRRGARGTSIPSLALSSFLLLLLLLSLHSPDDIVVGGRAVVEEALDAMEANDDARRQLRTLAFVPRALRISGSSFGRKHEDRRTCSSSSVVLVAPDAPDPVPDGDVAMERPHAHVGTVVPELLQKDVSRERRDLDGVWVRKLRASAGGANGRRGARRMDRAHQTRSRSGAGSKARSSGRNQARCPRPEPRRTQTRAERGRVSETSSCVDERSSGSLASTHEDDHNRDDDDLGQEEVVDRAGREEWS